MNRVVITASIDSTLTSLVSWNVECGVPVICSLTWSVPIIFYAQGAYPTRELHILLQARVPHVQGALIATFMANNQTLLKICQSEP